jgi:hypothetical protein
VIQQKAPNLHFIGRKEAMMGVHMNERVLDEEFG